MDFSKHLPLIPAIAGLAILTCVHSWAQAPGESASPAATPPQTPEPVISFEPGGPAQDRPAVAERQGEPQFEQEPQQKLSFNFRYAPWDDVLERFADVAGLTLDLNDIPPGTFNYYDTGTYTPTEALDILNGYLLQKGYVLVRRDQFLVSVNIDRGVPPNLVPNVTVEELAERGKTELLSVVFPLEEVEAETAGKEVEALLGPQGSVVALTGSNSLVVTDIGSNLRRVQRLLKNVTATEDPRKVVFRAFPVKNVPAYEAERIVRSMLGLSQGIANVSASNDSWGRSRYSSRSREQEAPQTTSNSSAQLTTDTRTNSLLVAATADELALVEQALQVIDVVNAARHGFDVEPDVAHLRVYSVKSADPREVTKTLDAMMPGVVVNEDRDAKRIHIFATSVDHQEVEKLIQQLDGVSYGGSQEVAVITLKILDPYGVTATLRSLFASDGDQAPTIEPDLTGRLLMVRGTSDQVAQVRKLLADLGEDGTGNRFDNPQLRGPVRSVPLAGRDPDEFLKLIEQLWGTTSETPIRVVVPSGTGPIRDRRTPSAERRESESSERKPEPSAAIQRGRNTVPVAFQSANPPATADDEDAPAGADAGDARPDVADAEQSGGVSISLSGDNLVISSTNLEALDRLEQLIETLARAMPPKTRWTVFYLRSADATQAAATLEQLFPTSSVSLTSGDDSGLMGGLSGGLASMGRGLADLTGISDFATGPLTLRIIPEIRSNALFVSGPHEMVSDVEEVLRILDASELPESLRDRVPRTIPVEYADVNEVAAVVRDVYRDYLEPSRSAGGRNNNPLAMLMGGNGGGSNQDRNRREPEVQMTIGVDNRTGQIVVSANDALFQQVETLVKSLDHSAFEAQRTVHVVRLQNADAATISQVINSMVPNVTVSTAGQPAGGPRSSSSQPSSSRGGDGERDNQENEQLRRLFEQRIQERIQQQIQGGGVPGNVRPSVDPRGEGSRGGRSRGGR